MRTSCILTQNKVLIEVNELGYYLTDDISPLIALNRNISGPSENNILIEYPPC